MKFLHVNAAYWPFQGGAERYAQELSERLARDGDEVTLVTTDAGSVEHFWVPGKPRCDREQESHNGVYIRRCRVSHLPLAPYSFYLWQRAAIALSGLPLETTPLLRWMARYMPWVPESEATLEARRGARLLEGR